MPGKVKVPALGSLFASAGGGDLYTFYNYTPQNIRRFDASDGTQTFYKDITNWVISGYTINSISGFIGNIMYCGGVNSTNYYTLHVDTTTWTVVSALASRRLTISGYKQWVTAGQLLTSGAIVATMDVGYSYNQARAYINPSNTENKTSSSGRSDYLSLSVVNGDCLAVQDAANNGYVNGSLSFVYGNANTGSYGVPCYGVGRYSDGSFLVLASRSGTRGCALERAIYKDGYSSLEMSWSNRIENYVGYNGNNNNFGGHVIVFPDDTALVCALTTAGSRAWAVSADGNRVGGYTTSYFYDSRPTDTDKCQYGFSSSSSTNTYWLNKMEMLSGSVVYSTDTGLDRDDGLGNFRLNGRFVGE